MRKINYYKLLFFVVIFSFVLSGIVFAKETACTGSNCLTDPFGGKKIFDIIQSIIGYLIKIGAPILAIMVIYGGFLILSAGDSPEKVKSGKDVILWAVVGYTIVLCSWGVLYIMGEIIVNDPGAFTKPK